MFFDIGNRCVPLRNHVKPGLYAYAGRTNIAIVEESSTSLTSQRCLLYDERERKREKLSKTVILTNNVFLLLFPIHNYIL